VGLRKHFLGTRDRRRLWGKDLKGKEGSQMHDAGLVMKEEGQSCERQIGGIERR
jgi:hypothetical protein